MEKIIETENLTRYFGKFRAVDSVSLSVHRGEIYGFLGLNGAGKTTTIRMLLGLIRPTAGSARICGEQILPGGKGPWQRIGSLVEMPHSYPELTVREHLELLRRMRGMGDSRAVDGIVDRLGLNRYMEKKAGHLSLGNSQRLGIARALLHSPEVLILDEPSNGLDPAGIVEIRELLRELSRDQSVTIFVSSHNLDEVSRLAARIGIIHEGELLKEMDSAEIHSHRRRRLVVRTRDNARAHTVLEDAGYSVSEETGGAGAHSNAAAGRVEDANLAAGRGGGDGSGDIGEKTDDKNGFLELLDRRALDGPELVADLLVKAGIPPTALWEKEDDLESLFMRMIRREEETDE